MVNNFGDFLCLKIPLESLHIDLQTFSVCVWDQPWLSGRASVFRAAYQFGKRLTSTEIFSVWKMH